MGRATGGETSRRTRRALLAHAGQALLAAAGGALVRQFPAVAAAGAASLEDAPAAFAYVGCFTARDRQAHGSGISVYRVDPRNGAWTLVQVVDGELNPSFLVTDPRRPYLFVSHSDWGQVSAFRIDPATGRLKLINRQPTGGPNPAHVALAPSGRFVLAANYGGGSVAVIPVGLDGALGVRTDLIETQGELGPRKPEQSASHPHQCRFDPTGRIVAVPDLALDRIFLFELDEPSGRLRPHDPPVVPAGSGAGPRHVDFHPSAPFAYVANELDSTVGVYRAGVSGGWARVQVVPTVPASFTEANTAAEIEVSRRGNVLFVSNRGHDSIASFPIDVRTGMLSDGRWTATRGKTPRFFCQDPAGAAIWVANQATDTIAGFTIDGHTGALTPLEPLVEVRTPTAIAFGAAGRGGYFSTA